MINVEAIQKIAEALSVPVTSFFTAEQAETSTFYQSPDERTLLKLYREIAAKADKELT